LRYGEMIQSIRKANEMTQQDLADHLGVSQSFITKLERNEREPSVDMLIKLSSSFRVSTDYLLGLITHKNETQFAYDIMSRVEERRKQLNISKIDFANRIGMKIGEYDRLFFKGAMPDLGLLLKMAETLNSTTDYLLGRSIDPNPIQSKIAFVTAEQELSSEEVEYVRKNLELYREMISKRDKSND
jgi:transcriptional regulator with XRE-family HTH domain